MCWWPRPVSQPGQWDARILAAAESRCRLLLTENLRAGFIWRGVTAVNPFAQPADTLLAQWLNSTPR